MSKDKSVSQKNMEEKMAEIANSSKKGGLVVQDKLLQKNQDKSLEIQKEEAKVFSVPKNINENPNKTEDSMKKALKENYLPNKKDPKELLKPAIKSVDMSPAIKSVDMRSAAESTKDSPAERALNISMQERNSTSAKIGAARKQEAADRMKMKREQRRGNVVSDIDYKMSSPKDLQQVLDQGLTTTGVGTADSSLKESKKEIGVGEVKTAEGALKESTENGATGTVQAEVKALNGLNNLISQPTKASGIISQTTPIDSMPSVAVDKETSNIKPVIQSSPAVPDVQSAIASDKASTSPKKTEIMCPELGTIATESGSQNEKLDTLIKLFQEVVEALKPKSTPIQSSGGIGGDTSTKNVVHKPANYFRNTVGLVSQGTARSVLNIGPPKA